MKKLIGKDIQNGLVLGGYTFTPSTNTVTITGMPPLTLEQILLITDVTAGIIIFNFASAANNGSIANNVITLDYNCTALSATDRLQIYIDIPDTAPTDSAMMNDAYTHVLLKSIAQSVASLATQDAAQRQRVSIDAAPASITVGTLPTLANVTTLGTLTTVTNAVPVGNVATWGTTPGGNIEWQMMDWARHSYNVAIRSQLTFGN